MTEIALRNGHNEITGTAPGAIVEWANAAVAAHNLAISLCATAFCPDAFRNKPGEATAAILAGAEVGLSPMAALNAYDVIQGRPAPKAITMRAIAQSHGHNMWPVVMTPTKCVMRGQRRGTPEPIDVEWSITRARDLALTNKPNWKNQPQAMLVARATSELARLIAADVLLGIPYSSEELDDQAPAPTVTVKRGREKRTIALAAVPEPAAEPDLDEPAPPPAVVAQQPVEPAAEPDLEQPDGAAVTRAQITKIQVAFKSMGLTDRATRLQLVQAVLGKDDLASANQLTKAEATTLIDILEQCMGEPDPAVALWALAGLGEPITHPFEWDEVIDDGTCSVCGGPEDADTHGEQR